jgi:hypothetical protein
MEYAIDNQKQKRLLPRWFKITAWAVAGTGLVCAGLAQVTNGTEANAAMILLGGLCFFQCKTVIFSPKPLTGNSVQQRTSNSPPNNNLKTEESEESKKHDAQTIALPSGEADVGFASFEEITRDSISNILDAFHPTGLHNRPN